MTEDPIAVGVTIGVIMERVIIVDMVGMDIIVNVATN